MELDFFKNTVGSTHVDRSSPTFKLFPRDNLLKALNSEIVRSRLVRNPQPV